jgi:DNA-binding response OmpR family regulator
MILLISSSNRAEQFASSLRQSFGEEVHMVATGKQALSKLRNNEFSAMVLDETFVETEGEVIDLLMHHSGMAVPVYVNLAISAPERVVREVRAGFRRHEEAKLIAIRAAESMLRTELRGAITGILLSTELALRSPEMPHDAAEKLRSVCQLATDIRNRLETIQ